MNTVNQTSPGAHGASPPRPSTAAKPARTAGSLSGGRGEAHRAAHVSISPAARAAHADQVAPVSTKNPNPQKQPVRFDDTGNLTYPNPQKQPVRFDDTGNLTYPNPQKQPVRFDDTGNLTHPNPQESSVGPVGWDVGPVGSDVGPIGSDVGPIGFDPGPK